MKIKLTNVSKYYKSETNVSLGIQNVSAEFESGEIVAIIGESGSGKSTFLNVVSLMDSFEAGELLYDDIDVSGLSSDELEKERRSKVSFIFQNYNIIDSYTVLQNVMLPLTIRGYKHKEAVATAKKIISRVGLDSRVHHKGTKLSGGEKQRCVIARALASDSKILACDEPTGNLDSKTGAEIMALIKEISKDRLVFIVTHNFEEIKEYATRELKFFDGKLVEDIKLKDKNEAVEKETIDPSDTYKALGMLKIATDNIISTPKKSIFSFIITACISFIVVLLIGLITSNANNNFYHNNYYYNNTDPNRIVTYRADGDYLDINNYQNNVGLNVENIIYSEVSLPYKLFNQDTYFYYKQCLTNETLLYGRMPNSADEVVLGLANAANISQSDFNDLVIEENSPYKYYNELHVINEKFNVVGVYASDYQNYITGNNDGNEVIIDYVLDEIINPYKLKNDEYDFNAGVNTVTFSNDYYKNKNNRDFIISVLGTSLNIDISNIDFEIVINPSYKANYPQIALTKEKLREFIDENISVGCSYTTPIESTKVMKKINSLDLVAVWPAKNVSSMDQSAELMNRITTIFLWIGVIFIIFVIYLITYLVLSRVYKTKNKDYIILRTLGLSKKSSGIVVKIENVILTLASAIFAVIIAKILEFSIPKAFSYLKYFSIGYVIVYLIIMIIFAYFLGRKFNKRVFAFSVQETLRGGVLND